MLRRLALSGMLAVGLTGAMASTQSAQAAVVPAGASIDVTQTADTAATPIGYYGYGYGYNYYPRYYRPYYTPYYYPRYNYYSYYPHYYRPYRHFRYYGGY